MPRESIDTGGALRAVGSRGGRAARRLLFQSEELVLHVEVRYRDRDDSAAVEGQLLGRHGVPAPLRRVQVESNGKVLARAHAGPAGDFHVECRARFPLQLAVYFVRRRAVIVTLDPGDTERPAVGESTA